MNGSGVPVTIVNACRRDGRGGSPTAVLAETPLSDDRRRNVPVLAGTSHAVFFSAGRSGLDVSLRFFTSEGELPACGHGTVAALASLAERAGNTDHQATYQATIRTPARVFTGHAVRHGDSDGGGYDAGFDLGPIGLREPEPGEYEPVLHALGITPGTLAPGIRVASPGRPRLLVPVTTRSALAGLAPDFGRLRGACDRLGLLGCYAHSTPAAGDHAAARMFAPSIGVPEDIANANGTACLAACLLRGEDAAVTIAVDMGDSLGAPSTITAAARHSGTGPLVRVGGAATIIRTLRLPI